MFYVSGNKIYIAVKDDKLGVYREVNVETDSNGNVVLIAQQHGVANKPEVRTVCSYEEIVAQFGGATSSEVKLSSLDLNEASMVASNSTRK